MCNVIILSISQNVAPHQHYINLPTFLFSLESMLSLNISFKSYKYVNT